MFLFGRGDNYFETAHFIEKLGHYGNEVVPEEIYVFTVYQLENASLTEGSSDTRPFGSKEVGIRWMKRAGYWRASIQYLIPSVSTSSGGFSVEISTFYFQKLFALKEKSNGSVIQTSEE